MYVGYGVELNDEDTKFEAGDRVRIPKYKNIFEICLWKPLQSSIENNTVP